MAGTFIAIQGCRSARHDAPPLPAVFRTDSAQYTVASSAGFYRAMIGFAYVNPVRVILSSDGCHGPRPPALEKMVDGAWIVAYHPVVQLCQNVPPFRLAPGARYRGALTMIASRRGSAGVSPLLVDSIPGTYRLRWTLRVGANPNDPTAVWVVAISNAFRLVEH